MDFGDIDKELDMRIVFSYSGALPVAQFTKKSDFTFQSALHFGDKSLELSYFIPEELGENREVAIFLAQANARREGNVHFMNYSLSQQDLFSALTDQVVGGKSSVVDNMLLTKGNYLLSCRFHSSDRNFFSKSVLKYANLLDGLGISYLGPNPGIHEILNDIKKSVSLRNFEWQVRIPDEILHQPPFSILPEEWVAETRYMTTGQSISGLLKTAKPVQKVVENGLSIVSEQSNLYEFPLESLTMFLEEYFSKAYESRLVRFRRVLHFKNGILRFNAVIPKVLSESLVGVLGHCNSKFPEWQLRLNNISDL